MLYKKNLCPLCSSDGSRTISINLYFCKACQIAFNAEHTPLAYDNNYFIDEYKSQYGRTYLDDYEHIYAISLKRLKNILDLIKINKKSAQLSLLDIGSAMGFFLKCAKDSGIQDVCGIEISEYACKHCKEELGIDVIQSPFNSVDIQKMYDIITSWYFIEHCESPLDVISSIYKIINKGGIFAFSTPSIFGPLFKFDKEKWVHTHPKDHRIDFSPHAVKKILKKIGFKKVMVKPGGIHPERVFSSNSVLYKPLFTLYTYFSRITSFSDTIEVYAVK